MIRVNLKIIFLLFFIVLSSSYLLGCSTQSPLLIVAEQNSYEDELKLVELSKQLYSEKTDTQTKMRLLYQRGMLYDSLGFKVFAQNDLSQLLTFNIAIPNVYNYLGMRAMENGNYDAAFMTFNTVQEIDSDFEFTYINRGIALYRTDKYDTALDDILKFYNYAPNDPMRILWVYLVEEKLDKSKAMNNLQVHYNQLVDKTVWGSDIIAFYLGKISEDRLMINLQQGVESDKALAQRLCETYFYLGKYYQSKGNNKRAEMLFKYTLTNNVYNYLEHQQALFEINQLTEK